MRILEEEDEYEEEGPQGPSSSDVWHHALLISPRKVFAFVHLNVCHFDLLTALKFVKFSLSLFRKV